jgi:hypothetical protein
MNTKAEKTKPAREMNARQLQEDMATIKSVLSETDKQTNPHRKIIAGGNLFLGILALIAIPFLIHSSRSLSELPMDTPQREGFMFAANSLMAYAMVLVPISLIFFLTAWGVAKRKKWGVVMAVITGILSIPGIPIGTAFGIYTFWAAAKGKLKTMENI